MGSSGSITALVAVLSGAIMFGCVSLQDPSEEFRQASYNQFQGLFTGNEKAARRQTYIVFSGDGQFRVTMDSETGNVKWFSGGKGFSRGLAVALESDGYLVTVGHALSANNFVFGWFDGKKDVKPARIIFKRATNSHADVALIKTEGKLDQCGVPAERPALGDRVFAVVCNGDKAHLVLEFASGTVLGITPDPVGGPIDLIKTDVPLARGDSGGPLLSSSGYLIGINSGINSTWRKHWSDSFFPDKAFTESFIAEDRALRAHK